MDRDPRLELEEDTKATDLPTVKEMRDLSVQDRAEKTPTTWGLDLSILLSWPSTDPEGMPPWPSSARDARLREFWPQVPLLAAVITAFVSRIKTLPYRIEADDEKDATYWNWVLSNGDFGKGWGYTIGKGVLDLLTQDNGLFIEVLRPARARGAKGLLPLYRLGPDAYAIKSGGDYVRLGKRALKAVTDDPWETPIGIAHLDAGKCVRLRDPETPVQYRSQKGARPLKAHQVFDASWMTSAEENRAGYGMCPVTLALIASRITKNIDIYVDEKVGGRYFKRIIYGTNIFQGRLEQAIKEAEAKADARGQTRYATNIVVGSADLTSPGEVGVLDLTGLPDGFDRETEYDIAADLIIACFGLDRPEVIPMRTATLGQAGQVGVMAMKAKGKGPSEVIRFIERFVSNWLLPSDGSVSFAFDYKDDEEDARRADIKNKEADTLVKLSGAPTAEGMPVFTRSEFRSLCKFYELVPEKMLTEEEKEETPAVEQEEEEKAVKGGPGSGWHGPPKGSHGGGAETGELSMRSKREREAIENSEYLSVVDEEEYEGYHWTNPANRWKIQKDGLKGVSWDENLGFTSSSPKLSESGAVFAFTGLNRDEGADWGPQAIVFKVTGYGYLVNHTQEGLQYIFRADESKADYVGSLKDVPMSKVSGKRIIIDEHIEKHGHKATDDEPPPDVRGKPLSKDEAAEGWEITEGDIEKAQAWVDRAMREAGYGTNTD